ncbi:hypothetical protein H311_05155, partial [Anncaliia algerae PRA109]
NEAIILAEKAINETFNRNIQTTPMNIMHGRNLLGIRKNEEIDIDQIYSKMIQQKEEELKNTNLKRKASKSYKEGDLVYCKTNNRQKTDAIWEGPYSVVQMKANDNILLLQKNGHKQWYSIRQVRVARR